MVTLLDCIERIPSILEGILQNQKENTRSFFDYLGDRINEINEIIFVGSGTSNTSAITSRIFVETVSGIETKVCYPSDFCYNTGCYNPKALYVFTSQTGNSIVTSHAQKLVQNMGYLSVSITESVKTPLAQEASSHINMGCGYEEYPMRTIGYSASVFTHMLLGLELGMRRGAVTPALYEEYLAQAAKVPESHRAITQKTLDWFQINKRQMMRSQCIIFTGAGALYGVALEGAVKVWEIPQIISIGYELEEGLHGPNYGYNTSHCVITLNDGGREKNKALALAKYMKEVWHNGLVVGTPVVDGSDLDLNLHGGEFSCLELSAVPQIIAYQLAVDGGRDLLAPHDNSRMEQYFKTHQESATI